MMSHRPFSLFLFLALALIPIPVLAEHPHLLYRGIQPAPLPQTATDQHGEAFKIAGLSGMTCAGGQDFYAVMDNSNKLLRFKVTFNSDCSIKSANITCAISLSETHDYEGAAFLNSDTLFLSDEDTPGIHAVNLKTGENRFNLPIPKIFSHQNIVKNQGFESLTLTPDKKTLFTATERATISDGNTTLIAEPFASSTRCRIQKYTQDPTKEGQAQGFSPGSQYLYQTSGVHTLVGQIGLCDLIALDETHLIALERSAAETLDRKPSIRTRIYYIDTTSARDISTMESIKDHPIKPVTKTLLYDNFIFDENGENLEGLCLGPEISPNRHILLGCIDNTDGLHISQTRLVAFELLLSSSPTRPAPRHAN